MSEVVPERTIRSRNKLTEALAAWILDYINSEQLPAGTHIAAQDLADRFSVSRSPVNQALRLLHDKRVLSRTSPTAATSTARRAGYPRRNSGSPSGTR